MTPLRCLASALALGLLTTCAGADEPACATRGDLVAFVAERLPGARVTVLEDGRAKAFLAAFNRLPPETGLAADEIVIVDVEPEAPALRVVLFRGGCLAEMGSARRSTVRHILNDIERSGA